MDNLIESIKKAMQPILTVAVVAVFLVYALNKMIAPEEVWFIVKCVIFFWFGYTAIKNFNFGNGPVAATPQDLIGIVKAQQTTINNAALDLGASVPVTVVEGKAAPVVSTAPAATTTSGSDDPDAYLAKLTAELSTDPGVK